MFYESGTSSHSKAAGFCLLLHDTCRNKRNTERKRERCKRKSHHNRNFIQEESFHRQDRFCETRGTCSSYTTERHLDVKPRGQSRGSALWSKEGLNICSCLAQELPFWTSGDLMLIKANQHAIETKCKGQILSVPTHFTMGECLIDCQYLQNGWEWYSVTFQLEGQCHRQRYPLWRAWTHSAS